MAAGPTDVIANELAIRLFLFGLAAMSFYEALKLERPRVWIAWGATALFMAAGLALTPISRLWPMGAAWLSELVINPLTWFVLAMSAYLILRPRWSRPLAEDATASPAYDDRPLREFVRRELASMPKPQKEVVMHYDTPPDLEARLKHVEQVSARFEAQERRERAKVMAQQYENMRMIPRLSERVSSKWGQNEQTIQHVINALVGLGIRPDTIAQQRKEIEDRMIADAQYLAFSDDDADKWQNATEKRAYLIQCAQFDTLMQKLKGIAGNA